MYIKEIDHNEFDSFAMNANNKSIYQTKEYAYTMEKQDFDIMFLGLFDGFIIIGATMLLIEKKLGFKYAYAPRGFLIDYKDNNIVEVFTKEIKKYLFKKDVMAVKINPYIVKTVHDLKLNIKYENKDYGTIFNNLKKFSYYHLGYNDFFEALKPRFEAIVDMNDSASALFKNLSDIKKKEIAIADSYGIKIYKGNEQQLNLLYLQTQHKYPRDLKYFEDLYKYFNEKALIDFFYAKLDTKTYLAKVQAIYEEHENLSAELNESMLININNRENLVSRKIEVDDALYNYKKELINATQLLSKYPDGIVLASALLIKNGTTVQVVMDGSNKEFKHLQAKSLLFWRLIEHYQAANFERFNLGGLANFKIDSKFNALNNFKLGYNAKIYEYIGDLELITNNTKYFMYRHSQPIRSILQK